MKEDNNKNIDFAMDLVYYHIFRDLDEKKNEKWHKLVYIQTFWLG